MIAVVGIGTGVGKTVVSAILVDTFKGEYWKPLQCGNLNQSDAQTVRELTAQKDTLIHSEAYRLQAPLSPHHAGRLENIDIKTESIALPKTQKPLIIEGVGGLLVPINDNTLFIDLLVQWKLPCLLVSRHYLGSINHTLLSIEALKSRDLDLLGIIFNGSPNPDTEQIIERFSRRPILGRLGQEPSINTQTLKKYASLWKKQLEHLLP